MSLNKPIDIVILTEQRYVNPSVQNEYVKNVLTEDTLVLNALIQEGLTVKRLSWDDPNFDWCTTEFVLFRTTWDYFDRFNEFSVWLNMVSKKTKLLNTSNIIHWNIDKHYLRDLSLKGIRTIPTEYIPQHSSYSMSHILQNNNWSEAILKPCISGGAYRTFRINQKNLEVVEQEFKHIIKEQDMMLQPFQQNILQQGEISLVVIDGKFTHAVLKKAKSGDYRVQDDYGGTVHHYTPTAEEIAFAEKTIMACPEKPIYARVDLVKDNQGETALIELELIEPELWFRKNTKASNQLAQAIKGLA